MVDHHWGQIPSVFCHITAVQNQQIWTLRLKLMMVVLSGQEEEMSSHIFLLIQLDQTQ